MRGFIPGVELHNLLVQEGQSLWSREENHSNNTDVWPKPGIIITVATGTDWTLPPSYRDRYFVCRMNEEENPIISGDPRFRLSKTLSRVVKEQPGLSDFTLGPIRWLLTRLQGSSILLWPNFLVPGQPWFFEDDELDQVPNLLQRLHEIGGSPSPAGALALSLSEIRDCRVFWEVAFLVGTSIYDYLISNPTCSEVYILHHHDKIVGSITDPIKRRQMVKELQRYPDLFLDQSGYEYSVDSETFQSDD